jgi:hypothetical protein
MKKSIISLFCLVCFGMVALNAQSSAFIGGQGGVNLSKFRYTSDLSELYTTTESLFGVNAGVVFGLEINNFTLSSGLQYIQKGSQYSTDNFEDENGVGFFTARERLHYVSVPLLLGYRKYLGDRFAISLAIGPSFNFGLGGKIDEEIEYFGSDEVEPSNYQVSFGKGVNEDYKPLQMGFQFSPGLVFMLDNRSKLTFNVTWDSGLSDSYSKRYKSANDFFNSYRGDQMNRSTIFSIGYERHFSFGDKY